MACAVEGFFDGSEEVLVAEDVEEAGADEFLDGLGVDAGENEADGRE